MAALDPRKLKAGDYKSADIGVVPTPREAEQFFWLVKGDKRVKCARNNVQDMIKHLGYQLEGPVTKELTVVQEQVELKLEGSAGAVATKAVVVEPNELEVLRARADELGVPYYPTTGKKKLSEAIAVKEAELKAATDKAATADEVK